MNFCLWTLALVGLCATQEVEVDRVVRSQHGAVVCVDDFASKVGAEVLARGGHAVDAAVAMGFALAVTHPAAGNIGGGGFMLVAQADGELAALDYREMAPAAATPEMFLDAEGRIDPARADVGHWVVGVPGTVAGLAAAHARFGTRPWAALVEPAIRLAADGFRVDEDLATGLAEVAEVLRRYPSAARCFLHADGNPYQVGEVLRQPDLANTLRWIAEDGAAAFYHGPIATLLAAEMRRAGGLITEQDLTDYRVEWREPVRFPYRGYEVVSMPPPSSGGVALRQILGILEPMHLRDLGPETASASHLLAEAQRRAFSQRAQALGDPEATAIDLPALLSDQRLDELRRSIDREHATPSASLGPELALAEGSDTTHFSIIDGQGNAVSNTYTLEQSFGSKVVAAGTGFLLNNELHDFNLKPGLTDRRGRIGTSPNLARAGRRPLSSMTPAIVRREGRTVLVTGSPGGRTIINSVACVLLQVLEFERPLAEAVAAPRQHHQWFPDRVVLEPELWSSLAAPLESMGHEVARTERQGDAHSIAWDPGTGIATAVADRRRDGWAAAPAD